MQNIADIGILMDGSGRVKRPVKLGRPGLGAASGYPNVKIRPVNGKLGY